jgi:hypothetical protein
MLSHPWRRDVAGRASSDTTQRSRDIGSRSQSSLAGTAGCRARMHSHCTTSGVGRRGAHACRDGFCTAAGVIKGSEPLTGYQLLAMPGSRAANCPDGRKALRREHAGELSLTPVYVVRPATGGVCGAREHL